MSKIKAFSLDNKYQQEEGVIILSGIQALVRLPLDQHKADKRHGLNTATLISGYRGSPVGALDFALQRSEKLLKEHHVLFMPGVNEDLGATSIFGSQLANLMPEPKYDGVVGMWYGKGPGVDRTGDIFKHANTAGVGRYGGVLAVAGDDPTAKSSTIASHSEIALYDAQMPILYPGTAQEILDMGRYGFELSRYCGNWVGFKIVTNVADEFSTTEVSPERVTIMDPGFVYQGRPWQHTQNSVLLAPHSLNQEREIYEGRLEAARQFAAANRLNKITVNPYEAWLGIVSTGKTYYDVREALGQIGLDNEALHRYGIRLLKVGMMYPLEPDIVREFAQGLEEVLVIEEKRAFIELFIRDILYDLSERPRVIGKKDEHGNFFVRGDYELDADEIVGILAQRLSRRVPQEQIEARLAILNPPPAQTVSIPLNISRTPYFCSGCPHNRSTVVPDGSYAGSGIGCHTLSMLMDRNVLDLTHMGGEGAQWAGASPFSNLKHMFQNIGDGTLFHSGSMAIRQVLTTDTNVTYKILYNSAVAMTGGQHADGELPVPQLTRELEAEGVKKIIVVSHDLDKYPANATWAANAQVWERDRLDEAQRILRDIPGVTVLIYDQPCAANLRRQRKRGQAVDPPRRVFINEAVCEGCGDCGVKSNCLSVFPVETEFGRKTQIHQSSCNKDYTCLEGDCPAFITVIPVEKGSKQKQIDIYRVEQALPEPQRKVPDDCNIYMMGIGGTGTVTINQILATAAMIDGKYVRSLDQTGLSQKGGAVVSNLKFFKQVREVSNKVAVGEADAYLVFDLLNGSTPKNLRHAHPDKTIAVVSSSEVPTGAMVKSPQVHFPQGAQLKSLIDSHTKAEENVYLDAVQLAENLFKSHMPANMIVIGVAYQAGLLPIRAEAIEEAIAINGVAVEVNQNAFRVGRLLVADPEWVSGLDIQRQGDLRLKPELSPDAMAIIERTGAKDEVQRLLNIRVPELIAYQSEGYAQEYADFVKAVMVVERERTAGQSGLSEAVARYLFKLMAYKDEYEVARLHLKAEVSQTMVEQFGKKAGIAYRLHPPFMRALGWQKKLSFGRWFEGGFRLLVKMKGLRGTRFDIFGYSAMRRLERTLIEEYKRLIEDVLADLAPENYEQAVKLAKLPDIIRGYEEVKLKNVDIFRAEVKKVEVTKAGVEV